MSIYNLNSQYPNKPLAGDILNCPYSGGVVPIKLPAGKYKLECWGAQGGYRSSSSYGGKGGYSVGTLNLSTDTLLYLRAGGSGGNNNTNSGAVVAGGYNGGGYRYGYPGGGGASDIRIRDDSLYARVIVAGGGGSDGATSKTGMYGGGTSGGSSTENFTSNSNNCGKGGTQTYSGSSSSTTGTAQITNNDNNDFTSSSTTAYYGGFGYGGIGICYASGYGGAGGGGWYGGSGTIPDGSGDDDRGGGGGSGYVYTSSTASSYPSGCKLNSAYYLTNASTATGGSSFIDPDTGNSVTGRSGNGYVRITILSCQNYSGKKSGSTPTILNTVTNIINAENSNLMTIPKKLSLGTVLKFNPTNTTRNNTNYKGTIMEYTFPATCKVRIHAAGARGGNGNLYKYGYNELTRPGFGAYVYGIFEFKKNDKILIAVGQRGTDATTASTSTKDGCTGSGGGGTFVIKKMKDGTGDDFIGHEDNASVSYMGYKVSPLLIAAGGNGGRDNGYSGVGTICGGLHTTNNQPAYASTKTGGGYNTAFGSEIKNDNSHGYGLSFLNGALGSQYGYSRNGVSYAGFGGGGSNTDDGTGGGGGGYYGGISGISASSFNSGTEQGGESDYNDGDGYVVIEVLEVLNCPPLHFEMNNKIYESNCIFVKINNQWKPVIHRFVKANHVWNE